MEHFTKSSFASSVNKTKKASQCVVGGHIFWFGYEKLYANDGGMYKNYMMVSFDLVTHRFQELYIPDQLLVNLPLPFFVSNLRDNIVLSGNINLGDHYVFWIWLLTIAGGTIASFQCLLNIPTPCQLKLIGFNLNNDPILEVQNPEGFATTLGLYNIASGTFHNLGIEGDGVSFVTAFWSCLGCSQINRVYVSLYLQTGLPIVLEQAKVFEKKRINPANYAITFKNAHNIPSQGGLFGDCGIWVCIFLYRLAYGKSLEVDNHVQAALAYPFLKVYTISHMKGTWFHRKLFQLFTYTLSVAISLPHDTLSVATTYAPLLGLNIRQYPYSLAHKALHIILFTHKDNMP
ncbi:F-box domain-containing protein [Artemisia annua]|uniref:F-box domain-containing protein n=1 Tax=Artemisia annua TaxID=35608 RepID=A0A2U1NMX5_ARTAN|nr:F-box domain-containing protein [Artemisia annua]